MARQPLSILINTPHASTRSIDFANTTSQRVDLVIPTNILENIKQQQLKNVNPGTLIPSPPNTPSLTDKENQSFYTTISSLSPETSIVMENNNTLSLFNQCSSASLSQLSRPSTPAQFVFEKPSYDKNYHKTHFHHHHSKTNEKKEGFFKDLKRLLFRRSSDKKKSSRSSTVTAHSATSVTSFANEFNTDLEDKYGTWGK